MKHIEYIQNIAWLGFLITASAMDGDYWKKTDLVRDISGCSSQERYYCRK